MSIALFILSILCTYFFIGYVWICWNSYRRGAGFWVPDDHPFRDPLEHKGMHICLWPICMSIYFFCWVAHVWKTPRFLQRFTPDAYHERGRIDNDADYQAEKHLLR